MKTKQFKQDILNQQESIGFPIPFAEMKKAQNKKKNKTNK